MIATNNSLRRRLRSAVASFALSDPDADVRLAAVREMLRSLDEDSVAILRERLEKETDPAVKKAMIETGLALADLDSGDRRYAARGRGERSRDRLSPDVYNRLTAMVSRARGRRISRTRRARRARGREVMAAHR